MAQAKLQAVISADARKFNQTIGRLKSVVRAASAGMALGISAGSAALVAFAKKTADFADDVGKLAKRTGLSTDAVQRFRIMAELSGAELTQFETALRRMQKSIVDLGNGLSTPARAFGALGLRLKHIENLDPEEQFMKLLDALSKVEDPTKRAGISLDIFGRAGTRLLPFLDGGAAGLNKLSKEADRVGGIMSPEQIANAEKFKDSLLLLQTAALTMPRMVIADNFPDVINRMDQLTERIVAFRNSKQATQLAKDFVAAVEIAKTGFASLFKGITILKEKFTKVADFILDNPIFDKLTERQAARRDEIEAARVSGVTGSGLVDLAGRKLAGIDTGFATGSIASEGTMSLIKDFLAQIAENTKWGKGGEVR